MAESPGALEDTWGWYQDAGDWDSYETHLRVAQELLLAYEMRRRNFRDGELNIPESGNGVPDYSTKPHGCRGSAIDSVTSYSKRLGYGRNRTAHGGRRLRR